MDSQKRVRIRTRVLKREIENRDLRHWWVAERMGVHRTTLYRWLKGEIVSIRDHRLVGLSEILEVEPCYLRTQSDATRLATPSSSS